MRSSCRRSPQGASVKRGGTLLTTESVSKMLGHTNVQTTQIYARITERKINLDMDQLSKKLDPKADVYKMPESEYRARKSRKLRRELQEFALANGVPLMN